MSNALLEKLPILSDSELSSLHANALRLSESGSKQQKDAAVLLLPAIEKESAARSQAKSEKAAAAKAARPKGRKKAVKDETLDDAA